MEELTLIITSLAMILISLIFFSLMMPDSPILRAAPSPFEFFFDYGDRWKPNQKKKDEKKILEILLLIAHPDDETMFFSPLLRWLNDNKRGYNYDYKDLAVTLLCLSSGNHDGKGDIRKQELTKFGQTFGLKQVIVLNDEKLQDGPNNKWDAHHIQKILDDHYDNIPFDILFTFDESGVSGHSNHIATYLGAKAFMSEKKENEDVDIIGYKLISRSFAIKFTSFVEVLFPGVKCLFAPSTLYLFYPSLFNALKGMMIHRSQFVWYRGLFVLFSQYAYLNVLSPIL